MKLKSEVLMFNEKFSSGQLYYVYPPKLVSVPGQTEQIAPPYTFSKPRLEESKYIKIEVLITPFIVPCRVKSVQPLHPSVKYNVNIT